MSLLVEWRNGHSDMNNSRLCLIALPGVGNIGKAAVDALNETNAVSYTHLRAHET